MPIDIVGGIQGYLEEKVNITTWEGEIPRYDTQGNPIYPGVTVSPPQWPVVQVTMPEQGFTRTWTTEDPYADGGELHVRIWGTTRASVLAVLSGIEAALASIRGWTEVNFGGDPSNPNYLIQALLRRWSCFQEEGVRTDQSEFLYQGQIDYQVDVHGAIPTS